MVEEADTKPGQNEARDYLEAVLKELRRREELLGVIDAQIRQLETRVGAGQMTAVLITGEADQIKSQAAQLAALRSEIERKVSQRREILEDINKAKARVELARADLKELESR